MMIYKMPAVHYLLVFLYKDQLRQKINTDYTRSGIIVYKLKKRWKSIEMRCFSLNTAI